MGIRDEFYASLRDDYELEGERSFLYRYFQARPRQRRGGTGQTDVKKDVQTFLYDVAHGRKKDQTLAMLDEYCAYRGVESLLSGGGQDRDLPIEEVEAFYQAMRQGDNKWLLIPLKIDPGTGAGLYIMGTAYLAQAKGALSGRELDIQGACCYVCLYMEDLRLDMPDEQSPDDLVWSIGSAGADWFRPDHCGYPNLQEALRWFRFWTAMDTEGGAYQTYSEANGPMPENCPDCLRRYFEQGGQDDWDDDALIARGRKSFARD